MVEKLPFIVLKHDPNIKHPVDLAADPRITLETRWGRISVEAIVEREQPTKTAIFLNVRIPDSPFIEVLLGGAK